MTKLLKYWLGILKNVIFFFVPAVLFLGFALVYGFNENLLKDGVDLILSTVILASISLALFRSWILQIWNAVSLLILSIFSFLKISFYHLFQTKLDVSALYVIFETNQKESTGFLSTYVDGFIVFTVLILILNFVFALKFNHKHNTKYRRFQLKFKNLGIATFCLFTAFASYQFIQIKIKKYNLLYLAEDAIVSYHQIQNNFQTELTASENPNLNVKATDKSQTLVLVIGESTSAKHMSIYGYYRPTNPKLTELSDELIVFEDVISPAAHTIPALNALLTFECENGLASIIQLANQAGFKTYWISAQQPIGMNDTLVTAIAKAADKTEFPNAINNIQNYDSILFSHYEEALADQQDKKLIVLHLNGTHLKYEDKYPPEFNVFKDQPRTKFESERSKMQINTYDNAVLYNDFVVSEFIKRLKSKKIDSKLIYLSDHGDEVFRDIDFVGHNGYYSTKAMLHVPFIVWTSDSNKNTEEWKTFTKRKYIFDDFVHSFADLAKIEFENYQPKRSIFNSAFEYKPRITKQNKNYDAP
ncbi:sulfatase-like hydrolase/transferase [Psychroflexus aestuariivivens]|uniref:sulfatase-like hydrolase/transferase n=1 Tax=Psychroflexus aestuariivivens TaxID=1795040 RepID=UPI000FD84DCF|nr:sulfatase-like hydrolase/transferase [Psychroflexus aestuariivivens]